MQFNINPNHHYNLIQFNTVQCNQITIINSFILSMVYQYTPLVQYRENDVVLILYNGQKMLNKKAKLNLQNKENMLRQSTITTDTLNYRLAKTATGLIDKDLNSTDDRVKHLLSQNDQLKKTHDLQRQKSKQQLATMLKRTTKLQESVVMLENCKIENEQEIEFLQKKLTDCGNRCALLEQEVERLREVENRGISSKQEITLVQEKLAIVEEKYRVMESQYSKVKKQVSLRESQKIELLVSIEKLKKNWQSDITKLQNQITSITQAKSKAITEYQELISKSQSKIKTLMNQSAEKESKIIELQHKIKSNAGEFISKSNEEVLAIKQKYQQAQQKYKLQYSRLKQQHQKEQKEIIQKLQSELQQHKQKLADLQQNCTKWQTQYKKTAQSRDKMEAQLLDTKREILKIRQKEADVVKEKMENGEKQVELQRLREKDQENVYKLESLLGEKRDLEIKLNKIEREMLETSTKAETLQKQSQQLSLKLHNSTTQNQTLHQKLSLLASQVSTHKQTHQQVLEQLQANREEYQKVLQIETSKNSQLQELTKCLKGKIRQYQEQYENDVKVYLNKIKELETQKLRIDDKWKEQMTRLEEELIKGKKDMQAFRDASEDKSREIERKLRISQEEKQYLEAEIQKWKALRNQSNQQYEQLKRENRKLKTCAQELQQLTSKLKQQSTLQLDLQSKIKQLNQQKISLSQKHEQQLKQVSRCSSQKIDQLLTQNTLLQQKIKAKVESDLQSLHRQEIARIRRKSQDCNFTIGRYEKKIEELEALVADRGRNVRVEVEGLRREVEKKDRELVAVGDSYEECKKKVGVYREELEDLSKKYRQKQLKIQQLAHRLKKSQQSLNQVTSRSQTIICGLQHQLKTTVSKNTTLTTQLRKLETTNMRYMYELEEIQKSLKDIEKQKLVEEEKRRVLEKGVDMLEGDKARMEGELRLYKKSLQEMESSFRVGKKEQQYELQLKKKSQQISDLRRSLDKIENQLKIAKERSSTMQKNRRELYIKLSCLSNQHFHIEPRQNQLQFLLTLFQKLKSFLQIYSKLTKDRTLMQKQLKNQNEQFIKSFHKNYDENLTFKDNYDTLYRKYLKYKEAYIYCKTKLETYKLEAVNDQRFTQEILTHCKTFTQKFTVTQKFK